MHRYAWLMTSCHHTGAWVINNPSSDTRATLCPLFNNSRIFVLCSWWQQGKKRGKRDVVSRSLHSHIRLLQNFNALMAVSVSVATIYKCPGKTADDKNLDVDTLQAWALCLLGALLGKRSASCTDSPQWGVQPQRVHPRITIEKITTMRTGESTHDQALCAISWEAGVGTSKVEMST